MAFWGTEMFSSSCPAVSQNLQIFVETVSFTNSNIGGLSKSLNDFPSQTLKNIVPEGRENIWSREVGHDGRSLKNAVFHKMQRLLSPLA